MLVGKINVDVRELEKCAHNVDKFKDYSDSLVPLPFKHVKAVVDNQRYLCCLLIRNSKAIPWDMKTGLLNSVLCGISIVGYTSALIEVDTVLSVVSKEVMTKYKRKEAK